MRDRRLEPEERILWGKVAETARPLPGRMQEILDLEAASEAVLSNDKGQERKLAHAPLVTLPEPFAAKPKKLPGVHHPLEKPVRKKLAKGRLPIEARIDLHGLYQEEAHDLLLDFLLRAHERKLRHVLVITGKGSSLGSEGALKRAVPLWFSKPDFRRLLSSYEWAADHHGGEGALYVRLSRAGRGDGLR